MLDEEHPTQVKKIYYPKIKIIAVIINFAWNKTSKNRQMQIQ